MSLIQILIIQITHMFQVRNYTIIDLSTGRDLQITSSNPLTFKVKDRHPGLGRDSTQAISTANMGSETATWDPQHHQHS